MFAHKSNPASQTSTGHQSDQDIPTGGMRSHHEHGFGDGIDIIAFDFPAEQPPDQIPHPPVHTILKFNPNLYENRRDLRSGHILFRGDQGQEPGGVRVALVTG